MPSAAPNLIVTIPLYKSVPATFFSHFLAMDKTMVQAVTTVEGVYVPHAMDQLVRMALDHGGDDWERIVVLEHDVLPPLDAFERIATYSPERHIVGSVIFQHVPPYTSMVFGDDPEGTVKPFGPDIIQQLVATPALYACSAISLGCTSIHRDVLEKWDSSVPMFVQDNDTSHDVWFSEQARKQGFDIFVDSTLVCDHLSEMPINYSHNQAWERQYGEQG